MMLAKGQIVRVVCGDNRVTGEVFQMQHGYTVRNNSGFYVLFRKPDILKTEVCADGVTEVRLVEA